MGALFSAGVCGLVFETEVKRVIALSSVVHGNLLLVLFYSGVWKSYLVSVVFLFTLQHSFVSCLWFFALWCGFGRC